MFAGECQQILVAAVFTFHAGEAIMQVIPIFQTQQRNDFSQWTLILNRLKQF